MRRSSVDTSHRISKGNPTMPARIFICSVVAGRMEKRGGETCVRSLKRGLQGSAKGTISLGFDHHAAAVEDQACAVPLLCSGFAGVQHAVP